MSTLTTFSVTSSVSSSSGNTDFSSLTMTPTITTDGNDSPMSDISIPSTPELNAKVSCSDIENSLDLSEEVELEDSSTTLTFSNFPQELDFLVGGIYPTVQESSGSLTPINQHKLSMKDIETVYIPNGINSTMCDSNSYNRYESNNSYSTTNNSKTSNNSCNNENNNTSNGWTPSVIFSKTMKKWLFEAKPEAQFRVRKTCSVIYWRPGGDRKNVIVYKDWEIIFRYFKDSEGIPFDQFIIKKFGAPKLDFRLILSNIHTVEQRSRPGSPDDIDIYVALH